MTTHVPRDPDFDRRTRSSFAAQAAMTEFGAHVTDLQPGRIELRFTHDTRFTQQHGFLHAGVLAAIMDSACGYAAFTLMPRDAEVLTVEYKINLLRPARADEYRVVGEVVKAGRTITVAQATARAVGSDDTLALMTGSLISLIGANVTA